MHTVGALVLQYNVSAMNNNLHNSFFIHFNYCNLILFITLFCNSCFVGVLYRTTINNLFVAEGFAFIVDDFISLNSKNEFTNYFIFESFLFPSLRVFQKETVKKRLNHPKSSPVSTEYKMLHLYLVLFCYVRYNLLSVAPVKAVYKVL